MSKQSNELRMVEDLDQPDEIRSLLRAGIDDEVSGYDFDRGLATHLAAIAAIPTAAETAPAAQSAAAAAAISGKALIAWIGVPVASASVIAALWFGGSQETPAPHGRDLSTVAKTVPIAAHSTSTAHLPSTTRSAAATQNAPVVESPSGMLVKPAAPVNSAVPRTHTTRAQRNASVASATTKSRDGRDVTAVEPTAVEWTANSDAVAAETMVATPEAQLEAGPTAAEREAEARVAAVQAEQERVAREEARRVAEERLKREMAQLMRAKQSLTSNPAQALALAQAGEHEFRNSLFSEERQHVLILALIKLGRVAEAERRAMPYLNAHPDSPFARRVRNALETAK